MKRFLKTAVLLGVSLFLRENTYAQEVFSSADTTWRAAYNSSARVVPKGPKPLTHELSFGYRLGTDGWAAFTDIGKIKFRNARQADMFHRVSFFQIELTEKRSPKQEKLSVQSSSGKTGSYYLGKINNFYALKLGYGFRKLLAGKPDPGSVSIHWVNVFGASLGMVKPYYLNVISSSSPIKYTPSTESDFFNQNYILGSAGFGQGLGEMTFIPGGHFKTMLHFDFSANRKTALAIETGINVEYYSQPVTIMFQRDPQQWFYNVFLSFQFGKRW